MSAISLECGLLCDFRLPQDAQSMCHSLETIWGILQRLKDSLQPIIPKTSGKPQCLVRLFTWTGKSPDCIYVQLYKL